MPEESRLITVFASQEKNIALAWSVAALLSSILLIILYSLFPRVRRTPGWLVLRAAVCDLIVSFCLACLFVLNEENGGSPRDSNVVFVLLIAISVFDVCGYAYRAFMYCYLLSIYRNPFQPERHRKLSSGFVFSATFFSWLVTETIDKKDRMERLLFGLNSVPWVVFFVLGGAFAMAVRLLVKRVAKENERPCGSGSGECTGGSMIITNIAKQRVSRHGVAYFVVFGVPLTVGAFCEIMVRVLDRNVYGYAFMRLSVALAVGRPVFHFFGWFIINDVYAELQQRCQFLRRSRADSVGSLDENDLEAFSRELEKASGGIQERGFKEELRFELVFDVARGLGMLAQKELSFDHGEGPPIEIEMIAQGASVEARRAASSRAASSLDPRDRGGSSEQPLLVIRNVSNLFKSSPSTGGACRVVRTNAGGKGGVSHYGLQQFRNIREAFGISRDTYASYFPNERTVNSPGWRSKLKESVSEGASGSFFYRVMGVSSRDAASRLIVKQISKAEKETLVRILPAYEEHVQRQNGKSFICYYGLHSMKLWDFSRKVYFVVMRNFLPADMWLKFDLKGATMKRRALPSETINKREMQHETRSSSWKATLRDWEWLDLALVIDVSSEDKAEIISAVQSDAKFLADQNLLDYSLLLGIHRVPKSRDVAARKAHLDKMRSLGGYVSLDTQKVYFIGIIDVLETYTCSWKMQHYALKVGHYLTFKAGHVDGISAMRPLDYADRFQTFVRKEVLQFDWKRFRKQDSCDSERSDQDDSDRSIKRWTKLWDNRQRGLVREKMKATDEDHSQALEDLRRQCHQFQTRCMELEHAVSEIQMSFAQRQRSIKTISEEAEEEDEGMPMMTRRSSIDEEESW